MSDMINRIGPEKVVAIVTDNDATMIAATNLVIQNDHSSVIGQRCFSHVLNLFLKEDLPRVLKSTDSLIKSVTVISDEIKNCLRKNSKFRELWIELKSDDETAVFVTLPGEFVLLII